MLKNSRQIVPSNACLKCNVCCRYIERDTAYVPCFFLEEARGIAKKESGLITIGKRIDLKTAPIPYKDHYVCSFFRPEKNDCKIYSTRPFDCRLYPFMVTYDKDFKSIILVVDKKCPCLNSRLDSKEVKEYIDYIADILEAEEAVWELNNNKNFINSFQGDSVYLKRLENLTRTICLSDCGMARISLEDKALFEEYLSRSLCTLSSFSFQAIYIWSSVLNIVWKKIDDALCVFAGNDRDYFLLLPPIDDGLNERTLRKSLEILSFLNEGGTATRIENIPEEFSEPIALLGLRLKKASEEYLYNRADLAELKGTKFKSKRALANHFEKRYKYIYRDIEKKDIFDCLGLYREWAHSRLKNTDDDYYGVLIEDSYFALKTALMYFEPLNLEGRLVEIDEKIKGYIIGYPLNEETFVILFETTDLNTKGLSQFIFREFSRDLSRYKYINSMSDSGLENLRRVKNSYRPIKKIPILSALP